MPASLHASLLATTQRLVGILPPPLRRALDAWSARVARRRALQRQLKWQQQKAAALPAASRL